MAHQRKDAEGPIARAIAAVSTKGCASSENMKTLIPVIAISLMTKTSTIALASGVGGLAPAAMKAASEDKIARKQQASHLTLFADG
jgi:hypothetical protein